MPRTRPEKWANCPLCGERNNSRWDRCVHCNARLGPHAASDHLAVIRSFVAQAKDVGILDEATAKDLLDFAAPAPVEPATPAPPRPVPALTGATKREPVTAAASPAPANRPPGLRRPSLPPAPTTPPARPAPRPTPAPKPAREPSRTAVATRQWWDAARSDIAVHGFLYLGVVLTFVGVLGFLLFAFVDLPDGVQPGVELAIGLTFFGWAWMLRRQDALVVAAAMELVGGMVIPLIVFASLVDGNPIPPDVSGWGIVVAFPLVSLGLAGIYRRVAARRPESTLRFLVGPLLWLAAMTVGFAAKTDEPLVSDAITRLVPLQPALATLAIALSVLWYLRHRDAKLAGPTMRSAAIGLPFAYALTVAIAAGSGSDHAVALLLAGAGAAVSIEGLGRWYDRSELTWLRPLLVAGLVAPLALVVPWAWVGLVGTIAFSALLVHQALTGAPPMPVWVAVVGLAGSLGAAALAPWAMVIAFLVATIWAHFARNFGSTTTDGLATGAATLLPIGVVAGLWAATDTATATLATAGALIALSVLTRRGALDKSFWALWVQGASILLAIAVASQGLTAVTPWTVIVLSGSALAFAVAPGPVTGRTWGTGLLIAAAVAATLTVTGADTDVQVLVWSVLGLVSVTAAGLWGRRPAGHVAALGFLAGTGALAAGIAAGMALLPLWSWTAAALIAVAGEAAGREGLPAVLGQVADTEAWRRAVRLSTAAAFVLAFSVAAISSLARLDMPRPWLGVGVSLLALGYAAVTRVPALPAPERGVFGIGALLAALAGPGVSVPDLVAVSLSLAAVAMLPVLLTPSLRRSGHIWLAWLAGFTMVPVAGVELGIPPESLHQVLVPEAALLFLGGLVADDLLAGRRSVGASLRVGWLRYPVAIGAVAVPVAFGVALNGPMAGWWALAAAGVYGIAAWSLRAGLLSGPAWMFAVMGVALVSPWSVVEFPWLLVVAATPMVATAWLLERPDETRAAWLRWDLPALVGAHAVSLVALALAAGSDAFAPTALSVGLLSAAVGFWRKQRIWVDIGHVLGLVGAALLGPTWLLAALGATVVRGIWGISRSSGAARQGFQSMAVAASGLAWLVGADWAGWSLDTAGSATAITFGVGSVIIGVLHRRNLVASDTTWWWLGISGLGVSLATVQAWVSSSSALWPSVGLVLLAGGLELVRRPREVQAGSVALGGIAWAHAAAVAPFDPGAVVAASAVAAGVGGLVLAELMLRDRIDRWDGGRWGLLALAATIACVAAAEMGLASGGAALVVAAGTAASALAADRAGRALDRDVRFLAVLLVPAVWWSLLLGLELDATPALVASGIVASALALSVIGVLRWLDRDHDFALASAWVGLGTVGVTVVLGLSLGTLPNFSPVMALSLATIAAIGAEPLRLPWLREIAAVTLAGATALAVGGFSLEPRVALAVYLGLAAAALAAAVLLRIGAWVRPLEVLAWSTIALGLVSAARLETQTTALGTIALAICVGLVARALISGHPGPLLASPIALGVAILFFVNGQELLWHTIPIGLVLMLESALVERARKEHGWAMDESIATGLEWTGILIAVAPVLVGMFTTSLGQAVWALAVGAIVFLWGAAERVRRRVVVAAALVAGTMVLALFAGAAANAPGSAVLWIDAVGVGFAVMVAAGIVEAFRSRKGRVMQRVDELMEGWQ